jgi:hypothetical protein
MPQRDETRQEGYVSTEPTPETCLLPTLRFISLLDRACHSSVSRWYQVFPVRLFSRVPYQPQRIALCHHIGF